MYLCKYIILNRLLISVLIKNYYYARVEYW
nr:MAG TPA: hypothetical protein [Caudoviricetes sp.]